MTHCTQSNQTARMLLVEDEVVLLSALKKYFTQQGFEVDCARELEEAEALITTSSYSVVIADLRLSGTHAIEGLAVLRFIRQNSRDTRVIILTAHSSPAMRRTARELGAEAFLPKPTPLPEIAAMIDRLMAVAS